MRPTVIIGDIHGRTVWKEIVRDFTGYRFVFLGDYLDPFEPLPEADILDNLREIIEFRKQCPDDVVLLLGNHDMHYITTDVIPCSRFSLSIAEQASEIFRENYGLFSFAFQDGKNLFTHAGVNHWWFVNDFKGDLRKGDIAWQLNNPSDRQVSALCREGDLTGNRETVGYTEDGVPVPAIGGIFWASESEIKSDPLHGYTQYIGHSWVSDDITCHEVRRTSSKVWFCDCLSSGTFAVED